MKQKISYQDSYEYSDLDDDYFDDTDNDNSIINAILFIFCCCFIDI